MIIHSYLTEGFYPWAKLFLKSLKRVHGEEFKVCLHSFGLANNQQEVLYGLYKDLEIKNTPKDYTEFCKLSGLTEDEAKLCQLEVERFKVTPDSLMWKQYISVNKRYRNSIKEVMEEHPEEDKILHMDIDAYFVSPMTQLLDWFSKAQIVVRFRATHRMNRKIQGGIIGFTNNSVIVNSFIKNWRKKIDEVKLKNRPAGFGQLSFYKTYKEYDERLVWCNVPSNCYGESPKDKKAFVVMATGVRTKDEILKECEEDYERRISKSSNDENISK